ncbi:MAG: hypothetical protein JEY91_18925 [Spirochaetaceae bacterium]|nr:hypothetical protein [Spirochaetaceae bacterium]
MKKTTIAFLIIIGVLILTGCAAGPNSFSGTANAEGELAGFFMGLWHGCISFITFIISLFNDKVNVYEIHNKGPLYNFGFVLGAMIAYGGGGHGSSRKRRK